MSRFIISLSATLVCAAALSVPAQAQLSPAPTLGLQPARPGTLPRLPTEGLHAGMATPSRLPTEGLHASMATPSPLPTQGLHPGSVAAPPRVAPTRPTVGSSCVSPVPSPAGTVPRPATSGSCGTVTIEINGRTVYQGPAPVHVSYTAGR